jgi:hypothetical protein
MTRLPRWEPIAEGFCLAMAIVTWAALTLIVVTLCVATGPLYGLARGVRVSRETWRALVGPVMSWRSTP